MTTEEQTNLTPKNDGARKRGSFLQKLSQLAEAWEFDPQEALFLEVKALRKELRDLRDEIDRAKK